MESWRGQCHSSRSDVDLNRRCCQTVGSGLIWRFVLARGGEKSHRRRPRMLRAPAKKCPTMRPGMGGSDEVSEKETKQWPSHVGENTLFSIAALVSLEGCCKFRARRVAHRRKHLQYAPSDAFGDKTSKGGLNSCIQCRTPPRITRL